jgi:hypothetical protein
MTGKTRRSGSVGRTFKQAPWLLVFMAIVVIFRFVFCNISIAWCRAYKKVEIPQLITFWVCESLRWTAR